MNLVEASFHHVTANLPAVQIRTDACADAVWPSNKAVWRTSGTLGVLDAGCGALCLSRGAWARDIKWYGSLPSCYLKYLPSPVQIACVSLGFRTSPQAQHTLHTTIESRTTWVSL